MTSALVLAGHGSHISPQTAGLVWHHVDAIRRRGLFDEVTAAFWKESPSFHTVFNGLSATDITVVPLFTSQGFFTQTVIPAEMGLTGPITTRDGRTIRYTKTLSEHPYVSGIVVRRIAEKVAEINAVVPQTAVVIIGHSTRRNPESRKATEAQADAVRSLNLFAEVIAVYLDDSPSIPDVYTLTNSPTIIAVPYFLALGSHTTIDVPGELGLPPGTDNAEINGRQVYYTEPVGTEDSLQDVVIELARDAGAPMNAAPLINRPIWAGFPQVGGVPISGVFGQIVIDGGKVYCNGDDSEKAIYNDLGALREHLRGTGERFRSLATSNDLPGGWMVLLDPAASFAHTRAIIETIYPGLLGDMQAEEVTPLPEVIERQTGMFRDLGDLTPESVAQTVEAVCSHCLRCPTWYDGTREPLPCPEACNLWLSVAMVARETD